MSSIANVVDSLGALKMRIRQLREDEDDLKSELISAACANEGASVKLAGRAYVATVSFRNQRTTDWRAVTDALVESGVVTRARMDRIIAAKTQVAESAPVVSVTAQS